MPPGYLPLAASFVMRYSRKDSNDIPVFRARYCASVRISGSNARVTEPSASGCSESACAFIGRMAELASTRPILPDGGTTSSPPVAVHNAAQGKHRARFVNKFLRALGAPGGARCDGAMFLSPGVSVSSSSRLPRSGVNPIFTGPCVYR